MALEGQRKRMALTEPGVAAGHVGHAGRDEVVLAGALVVRVDGSAQGTVLEFDRAERDGVGEGRADARQVGLDRMGQRIHGRQGCDPHGQGAQRYGVEDGGVGEGQRAAGDADHAVDTVAADALALGIDVEQRASIPHSSKRAVPIPASSRAGRAWAWNGCAEMTGSDTTRARLMPRSRASLPIVASDPAPATMRVGI